MAIAPNPKIYNAADSAEITAINFGIGDAGSFKDAEVGIIGVRTADTIFTRTTGTWIIDAEIGKFIWAYIFGVYSGGAWFPIVDNDITTITITGVLTAGCNRVEIDVTESHMTEYHIWNDKGLVLGSAKMTSVKITTRDADGLEVGNIVTQKWAEIKSTIIVAGADIGNGAGDISDETDDDWPEFQAVGKENYADLGNIPANCYRVIFVRVNIPTSALQAGVTFSLYVTNQQPSSPIAKWITGLWGNGIVNGTHIGEVTDNVGTDSKIDIDSMIALISDRESYLSVSQTYTLPVVAGDYKVYLTSLGIISCTLGDIPSNSIHLATVTIADGVVTTIVDHRNIYSFQNYNRIIAQHYQDMSAADIDGIHTAITGTGTLQEITTGITNPDYARNASITTTNVAAPSGNVIITGIVRGVSDTESITIIAGSIAYGNKAFDTVTKITLPAGVTAADTVTVGFSDKIGLSSQINFVSAVFKKKVNNADATSELTGKVSAVYGTVDCGPISANKDMELRYIRGDDGTWVESPADSSEIEVIIRTTGDVTNNTTTFANITGLTFEMLANKDYIIEALLMFQSDTAATGIKFAVNGPAFPVAVAIETHIPTTLILSTHGSAITYDSGTASASVAIIDTSYLGCVKGIIRNGANAGTLAIRFAAETTGVVKIMTGSILRYRQVN